VLCTGQDVLATGHFVAVGGQNVDFVGHRVLTGGHFVAAIGQFVVLIGQRVVIGVLADVANATGPKLSAFESASSSACPNMLGSSPRAHSPIAATSTPTNEAITTRFTMHLRNESLSLDARPAMPAQSSPIPVGYTGTLEHTRKMSSAILPRYPLLTFAMHPSSLLRSVLAAWASIPATLPPRKIRGQTSGAICKRGSGSEWPLLASG
jgi:hypothetical protein